MQIIGLRQTQSATALADLINAAYRGKEGPKRWTTEHGLIAGDRIQADALADIILDKQTRVFTAFDDNDLPRCCIVATFSDPKQWVELGLFAVHPQEQGNGLGSRLLQHAESYAVKRARRSIVKVVNKNQSLINFYLQRGYQLSGDKQAYPVDANVGKPLVDDIELVVLEKVLG